MMGTPARYDISSWQSVGSIDVVQSSGYWNTQGALAQGWTPAQAAAVDGHQSMAPCESWVSVFGYNKLIDPKGPNSCGVPAADIYSADNPRGVRCSVQDYMA